ncbi:MAG: ergothioneine biosynthesis protein EgtB [Pseudomonadota bacterium]
MQWLSAQVSRIELSDAYQCVRQTTENLVNELGAEDQNLQPMAEASPIKWHRAHTSWFFETFILNRLQKSWRWINPIYCKLFNSYYNGIGRQHPRAMRSLISRPDHAGVTQYRQKIDRAMLHLIDSVEKSLWPECHDLVVLGLQHEQQHQELMLTDFKTSLPMNPLAPALGLAPEITVTEPNSVEWLEFEDGLIEIGADGDDPAFCFDNETPRHSVFLNCPYALASRPSNCEEFQAFIEDGGYQTASLWLADGWAWLQQQCSKSPLYWYKKDNRWYHYTLAGQRPVDPAAPICHLSFYEAAAFSEWSGARLPSEAEWENAACAYPVEGHFADRQRYQPESTDSRSGTAKLKQLFGSVWEWTRSSYAPYPGFRAAKGAIGEYNGKFMANQMVLRGGSCATPAGHVRASYRNFFYPQDRWQFSGVRLARDLN